MCEEVDHRLGLGAVFFIFHTLFLHSYPIIAIWLPHELPTIILVDAILVAFENFNSKVGTETVCFSTKFPDTLDKQFIVTWYPILVLDLHTVVFQPLFRLVGQTESAIIIVVDNPHLTIVRKRWSCYLQLLWVDFSVLIKVLSPLFDTMLLAFFLGIKKKAFMKPYMSSTGAKVVDKTSYLLFYIENFIFGRIIQFCVPNFISNLVFLCSHISVLLAWLFNFKPMPNFVFIKYCLTLLPILIIE